jgi:hypothetical protein
MMSCDDLVIDTDAAGFRLDTEFAVMSILYVFVRLRALHVAKWCT